MLMSPARVCLFAPMIHSSLPVSRQLGRAGLGAAVLWRHVGLKTHV
jgi:hypothetical protein